MLRLLHTADVHLGARHADLGEQAATPRLRAEVHQARVGAVHGDPEGQRDVSLELRGVVRHDVRAGGVRDHRGDASQQARSGKQFLAQRTWRGVADGDE